MLKKFCLVLLCALVCSSPVHAFGIYSFDNYNQWEHFDQRMIVFMQDVLKLANNIAAFNKPIFETKLTRQERKWFDMGDDEGEYTPIIYNRIWAKDKTLVLGGARSDKKFHASSFITVDPEIKFTGGIHVGASTRVLEKFFGKSLASMTQNNNGVTSVELMVNDATEPPLCDVRIIFKNGVITMIKFDSSLDMRETGQIADKWMFAKSTMSFARKQAQKMGFPAPYFYDSDIN
ncbi:MAG: hypothetical protein IJT21_08020 [Synergistaceae bacterium]|nr:hypothetical protein [Synergistaceae bacterium]